MLALAAVLAPAGRALGSLSLIATTPADGQTGVDTLMTLIMQFSEPLDTTARFEMPGGLFIGVEAYPFDAVGEPQGEITLSPDSTTVTFEEIPLEDDRAYIFVLTGAKSASGEMLDRPYVLTFSTGSALPQGTVSGTVSFPGGDPGGTAVGLFKEPPFGEGEEDGMPDLWGGAVVPLSGSAYTMPYVAGGSYYVIGFKDENQDGNLQFPGDAFGAYDVDGDSLADQITVTAGQDLTDIEVTVGVSPEITAREIFAAARNVARNRYPDAEASLLVGSPVTEEGASENWQYGFYSAQEETLIAVTRIGGTYFIFPLRLDDDDGPVFLDDRMLPEDWIDSDAAADTAEHYVGEQFRDQYDDAEVTAFAATFYFPEWKSFGPEMVEPNRAVRNDARFPRWSAQPDTFTAWVFSYQSEAGDDDSGILIDALTGMPITQPEPGVPTPARENLATADAAAAAWASDAVLVAVGNATDLSPAGFALAWGYLYHSAGKDSVMNMFIVSNVITDQQTDSTDAAVSLDDLLSGWMDSHLVTPVAEAASGDFRNQHLDATLFAQLSYGLRPGQPFLAVWRFMYQSLLDQEWLFIYVDAMTGEIITAVEDAGNSGSLPGEFSLEQNYPNPFNAETLINYGLPQDTHVELAVYNILGQRVRTLVDGIRPAGQHRARWDGTDDGGRPLASGLYFCRMKAGGYISVRKMLLVR
jgi:hypothetical protein